MLRRTEELILYCRGLIEEMRNLSLPHLPQQDPIKHARCRVVRELAAIKDPDKHLDEILALCRFAEDALANAKKLYGIENGRIHDLNQRNKIIADIKAWSREVDEPISKSLKKKLDAASNVIYKIYILQGEQDIAKNKKERYRANTSTEQPPTLCFRWGCGKSNEQKTAILEKKIADREDSLAKLYGDLTNTCLILYNYVNAPRRNALVCLPRITV